MTRRRRSTVRHALIRHLGFTAAILGVLATLAVAGVYLSARQEAERTAEQVSSAVADALVHRFAMRDFSQPAGFQRADVLAEITPYIESGSVYRVKVWLVSESSASIVLSDEARIEGETSGIDAGVVRNLANGDTMTHRVPADPEHRFEAARRGDLLEVFTGFQDAAGNAMALEAYIPVDTRGTTWHSVRTQLPLVMGGLLLLALASFPLTYRLARGMERDADERVALTRFALDSSDRERRELAQQLHDGPIQDLAAASIALRAGSQSALTDQARGLVRASIVRLRSLSGELLPAGTAGDGLGDSLTREVAALRPAGVGGAVLVPDGLAVADHVGVLLQRCCRELVRNAAKHAHATSIDVVVTMTGDELQLVVSDNGVGFDPAQPSPAGHLGLRLLEQLVHDAAGRLTVAAAPGRGTRATVVLPIASPFT